MDLVEIYRPPPQLFLFWGLGSTSTTHDFIMMISFALEVLSSVIFYSGFDQEQNSSAFLFLSVLSMEFIVGFRDYLFIYDVWVEPSLGYTYWCRIYCVD